MNNEYISRSHEKEHTYGTVQYHTVVIINTFADPQTHLVGGTAQQQQLSPTAPSAPVTHTPSRALSNFFPTGTTPTPSCPSRDSPPRS